MEVRSGTTEMTAGTGTSGTVGVRFGSLKLEVGWRVGLLDNALTPFESV